MMFFLTLERIREILSQTFIIKRVINNMACSLKTTNHLALDDMEKENCSSLNKGEIWPIKYYYTKMCACVQRVMEEGKPLRSISRQASENLSAFSVYNLKKP